MYISQIIISYIKVGGRIMKKDFLVIKSNLVELYLEGKRDNPKMCTTLKVAKQIKKKYKIKMKKIEKVNEGLGLYMFEIVIKKH